MPNSHQNNHPMTSMVNSVEDKAKGDGGGGGSVGGGGGGDAVGEGEEQEESSSHPSLDMVLSNFREQWQRELETSPRRVKRDATPSDEKKELDDGHSKGETTTVSKEPEPSSDEAKARELFMKGVGEERAGKLYEAIQWYRRAVQLVPDIESRLYKSQHLARTTENEDDDTSVESDYEARVEANEEEIDEDLDKSDDEVSKDEEEEDDGFLTAKLQRIFARKQPICQTEVEQKGVHISALPMEILIYILRWVVSPHLDLRSLESCSAVSRGFFLCSRDPEIWKLACLRVWGSSCGVPGGFYPTWRDMFVLGRPRIRFDGCYASKTTYVRPGENSFQDSCYRPWHLVVYYRYLRFFPGGTAVMLTTPDPPPGALVSLRPYSTDQHLLRGHYRLLSSEAKVVLVLHRKNHSSNTGQLQANNPRFRSGRRKEAALAEQTEQSFHLEFQILEHKRRKHVQLSWLAYTVVVRYRNGVSNSTSFDLSPADGRFPPLNFSRVRSYTAESDRPLQ
ncbi:F-box only protein 9 [Hetaerina americana]|uniref:F-box only protein 9 n=1 Tax=Hetaerina americana TaxID=62018 RepID=UPI003A7F4C09